VRCCSRYRCTYTQDRCTVFFPLTFLLWLASVHPNPVPSHLRHFATAFFSPTWLRYRLHLGAERTHFTTWILSPSPQRWHFALFNVFFNKSLSSARTQCPWTVRPEGNQHHHRPARSFTRLSAGLPSVRLPKRTVRPRNVSLFIEYRRETRHQRFFSNHGPEPDDARVKIKEKPSAVKQRNKIAGIRMRVIVFIVRNDAMKYI